MVRQQLRMKNTDKVSQKNVRSEGCLVIERHFQGVASKYLAGLESPEVVVCAVLFVE